MIINTGDLNTTAVLVMVVTMFAVLYVLIGILIYFTLKKEERIMDAIKSQIKIQEVNDECSTAKDESQSDSRDE